MEPTERVPGMQPGARRRNLVVGAVYVLVVLLVVVVVLSNTTGTAPGGGTVRVGVSTTTNETVTATPAGSFVPGPA